MLIILVSEVHSERSIRAKWFLFILNKFMKMKEKCFSIVEDVLKPVSAIFLKLLIRMIEQLGQKDNKQCVPE